LFVPCGRYCNYYEARIIPQQSIGHPRNQQTIQVSGPGGYKKSWDIPRNVDIDGITKSIVYSQYLKLSFPKFYESINGFEIPDNTNPHINDNYELNHGNSNNIPLLWGGAGWYTYWDDTPAQDDGQWHHWMVFNDISDTEGFKLYVDGMQIDFNADGTSGTPGLHLQGLTIGGQKHDTNNDGHAECSITNFAVLTGDKTGNSVAHYNNGIPKDLTNESDLEG
jgi:hypothetical protein